MRLRAGKPEEMLSANWLDDFELEKIPNEAVQGSFLGDRLETAPCHVFGSRASRRRQIGQDGTDILYRCVCHLWPPFRNLLTAFFGKKISHIFIGPKDKNPKSWDPSFLSNVRRPLHP